METQFADDLEYVRLLRGVKELTSIVSDVDAAIVIRRAVKKELALMLGEQSFDRNATLVDEAFGEIGRLRSEPAECDLAS